VPIVGCQASVTEKKAKRSGEIITSCRGYLPRNESNESKNGAFHYLSLGKPRRREIKID
jgi:hypothetical protein